MMLSGRHKFRVGQIVRPSVEAIAANLFRRAHYQRRGIVKKVDRFNCPTVLWEGRKTASSYHPDFIRPARKREARRD